MVIIFKVLRKNSFLAGGIVRFYLVDKRNTRRSQIIDCLFSKLYRNKECKLRSRTHRARRASYGKTQEVGFAILQEKESPEGATYNSLNSNRALARYNTIIISHIYIKAPNFLR